MPKNGVEFARKVGIVAAAVIAVGTIASWVSGKAWTLAMAPIVTEWKLSLGEERHARQIGDSVLVERMRRSERDRLDLIDMILTPQGERSAKAAEIRSRWRTENGHSP
jgi:hypothetical protein